MAVPYVRFIVDHLRSLAGCTFCLKLFFFRRSNNHLTEIWSVYIGHICRAAARRRVVNDHVEKLCKGLGFSAPAEAGYF